MNSSTEVGQEIENSGGRSVTYLAVVSIVCLLSGLPTMILEAGTGHIGAVLTISGVIFLSTYEVIRARSGHLQRSST